jgi:hypothetical protein
MPKVAQTKHDDDAPAEQGADALPKGARKSADAADEAVESAGRMAAGNEQREAAEDTAELGSSMAVLFAEQTRHSLEVAAALGRARNFGEVVHVQNEFIAGSFERMSQLSDRYLALTRTAMKAMPSPWRH